MKKLEIMEEILKKIRESVDRYNNIPLENYKELSEILRTLTSNLFYLEAYRVKAKNEWMESYFDCEGTNANKERVADSEVKELYMLRHLMSSVYRITDSLRSQISIYKKENH